MHYWEAVGSSGKVPIPAIVSLHRLSRKALPIGSTTELVLEGRAEAQVACQFNAVVLTFANLLPNASDRFRPFFCYIMEGYINRQESPAFEVGEEGSTSHLLSMMSKVVRRVTSDVAVLTFAIAQMALLPNASDRFCPFFCYIMEGVYKNRQESLAFEVGEEEVRVIYFR